MDTKELIYKKLKELTKQKFNDNSGVYDIGIDSLDLVELVTEAEDELGITLTDQQLEDIKTVRDIVKTFEANKK